MKKTKWLQLITLLTIGATALTTISCTQKSNDFKNSETNSKNNNDKSNLDNTNQSQQNNNNKSQNFSNKFLENYENEEKEYLKEVSNFWIPRIEETMNNKKQLNIENIKKLDFLDSLRIYFIMNVFLNKDRFILFGFTDEIFYLLENKDQILKILEENIKTKNKISKENYKDNFIINIWNNSNWNELKKINLTQMWLENITVQDAFDEVEKESSNDINYPIFHFSFVFYQELKLYEQHFTTPMPEEFQNFMNKFSKYIERAKKHIWNNSKDLIEKYEPQYKEIRSQLTEEKIKNMNQDEKNEWKSRVTQLKNNLNNESIFKKNKISDSHAKLQLINLGLQKLSEKLIENN